ncbi:hypothetical protein ACDY96_13145 [Rhizobium mongolense]|uniref:hypothetical protein n=1 Tax=Rhizobium TaxID=379 RepID=UPI0024B1A722|nr:hypothetical protein [Rhizobium sp. CC1099]WFU86902.1 hypothetical protein QA644_17715 [Rhizobium sp. CC1099]
MRTLKKILLSGVCLLGAFPAKADNLLIWAPVRVSEQSYKATMGFRLPFEWETSAGADLALASTDGEAIQPGSEQATFWGKITKASVTPAGNAQQDASLRIDTLRGSGSLMLSRSRSFILSDSLDLQTNRAVSVGYAAVETRQTSVTATQALKLIYPWTGTSISAGSSVTDFGKDFSSSVGVSQTVLPNLNLNASVTDPLSSGRSASVNVNYRVSW